MRVFNTQSLAKSYVGNLTATNADRGSDVLQLTLTSENFELSKDILNALIIAYNQDAINDKNSVARSTEAFIVDRIDALANDLSKVDTQIAGIKVASSSANMYADASSGIKYEENVADVEMQLSLAGYIRDYIANMTGNELIPSNTGITNTGIESDITKYNEAMLRYQTIATASSKENPVMIELNATLTSMKGNIMRTLNNYINSLRIKHAQARSQERIASSNIATVPTQEKAITEVTRQQKIKEQLYLYLLNKREENALQLANAPMGSHVFYLYAVNDDQISTPLLVWVYVWGNEPSWSVSPSDYESSMNVIGQIYFGDKICSNTSTIIAAFVNDECRGVAQPKLVSTRDAYFVSMPIYGYENITKEQPVVFRIYDAERGVVLSDVRTLQGDKSLTITYRPNQVVGSYDEPVKWVAGDQVEQSLDLATGWNWISLYNLSLQEAFADRDPTLEPRSHHR